MFVGHGTFAFGVAALAAYRLGWARERALAVGLVAGLFATAPDVDVLYALSGPLAALGGDPLALANAFWAQSTVVHRSVTHSVAIAVPAAAAAALWVRGGIAGIGALGLAAGVVAVTLAVSSGLDAAIMAAFAVAGLAVAAITARLGFNAGTVGAAALLGFATHPFGDVFTGEPPAFLYPFEGTVLATRVAPFGDPTLNLLLAFGAELAAIWFGVLVAARVADLDLRAHVSPRATAGAGFALLAPFVPAPTMDVSYHFVFGVLAVGAVGVTPRLRGLRLPAPATALLTGLAAVTLAVAAYAAAYPIV